MKETEIQLEICKDIRRTHPGAVAYKQSNQFLSGPPDLIISHSSTGPFMLEVKTDHQGPKKDRDGYPVGLTDLQRKWMRDLQGAGVRCGWALVVQIDAGKRAMFAGSDPEVERTPPMMESGFIAIRWTRRWSGESWSLGAISRAIK